MFVKKNIKVLLIVLSIVFILVGIIREEQLIVLNKAINV